MAEDEIDSVWIDVSGESNAAKRARHKKEKQKPVDLKRKKTKTSKVSDFDNELDILEYGITDPSDCNVDTTISSSCDTGSSGSSYSSDSGSSFSSGGCDSGGGGF